MHLVPLLLKPLCRHVRTQMADSRDRKRDRSASPDPTRAVSPTRARDYYNNKALAAVPDWIAIWKKLKAEFPGGIENEATWDPDGRAFTVKNLVFEMTYTLLYDAVVVECVGNGVGPVFRDIHREHNFKRLCDYLKEARARYTACKAQAEKHPADHKDTKSNQQSHGPSKYVQSCDGAPDWSAIWASLKAEFPGGAENKTGWNEYEEYWVIENLVYEMKFHYWYGAVEINKAPKSNNQYPASVMQLIDPSDEPFGEYETDGTFEFKKTRIYLAEARTRYRECKVAVEKYWAAEEVLQKRWAAVQTMRGGPFPIADDKPLTETVTRNLLKAMWYRSAEKWPPPSDPEYIKRTAPGGKVIDELYEIAVSFGAAAAASPATFASAAAALP